MGLDCRNKTTSKEKEMEKNERERIKDITVRRVFNILKKIRPMIEFDEVPKDMLSIFGFASIMLHNITGLLYQLIFQNISLIMAQIIN